VKESFFFGLFGLFVLFLDRDFRDFHDYLAEHFGDAFKTMIKISNIINWELFNLFAKESLFDYHLLAIHKHVCTEGT
jgi:hypothetical protein